MSVRNLRTISDDAFLEESVQTMLSAITAGDEPRAEFWAHHAASFVMHRQGSMEGSMDDIITEIKKAILKLTSALQQNHSIGDGVDQHARAVQQLVSALSVALLIKATEKEKTNAIQQ